MSTPGRRRLMRDFKKLQEDPPAGVSGAPTEDSILIWHAIIFGPQDTPFEDGTFKLTLEFTEEYPNKPPTVKFVSKMFHPNVYADGSICLDILQNRWSPTYDVAAILTSIQSLLDEPNPNSPANSLAAQLYQENRREYEKRVQHVVEQSWLNFAENEGGEEMKKSADIEGSSGVGGSNSATVGAGTADGAVESSGPSNTPQQQQQLRITRRSPPVEQEREEVSRNDEEDNQESQGEGGNAVGGES